MELITIEEAIQIALKYINKNICYSNITYLIQSGRIRKIDDKVVKEDVVNYYKDFVNNTETEITRSLGIDSDWSVSFHDVKESERTRHVHRLHPYKGKFIPQLVDYFLNDKIDKYKKEVYFQKDDIVLDCFAGSGTTLVQANELGINAIGVDISEFNALINNCKIQKYIFSDLFLEVCYITDILERFVNKSNILRFDNELANELNSFNDVYFPTPEYNRKVYLGEIDGKKYGSEKINGFLPIYEKLVEKYNVKLFDNKNNSFLEKWYIRQIRDEMNIVYNEINKIKNKSIKDILTVILSRTIRSCRATTHGNLATLRGVADKPYYCAKHCKICKPLYSMLKWWKTYSEDTIKRLQEFDKIRTDTFQYCLTGDSRNIDVLNEIKKIDVKIADKIEKQKIKGVFSSPPYVGLIDYHEQHAYAYELFGMKRNDECEIGPLFKGQTITAIEEYTDGIIQVLSNCKRLLVDDYNIFLVANDKYNIYPKIAEGAGMKIVNRFERVVLNRVDKSDKIYTETVFHLKKL